MAWDHDPKVRPPMSEIVRALEEHLRESLQNETAAPTPLIRRAPAQADLYLLTRLLLMTRLLKALSLTVTSRFPPYALCVIILCSL